MSGHSGFQPIGNNLPPIIPQPQVGDVRGPGQAPQSQPPAVSGTPTMDEAALRAALGLPPVVVQDSLF